MTPSNDAVKTTRRASARVARPTPTSGRFDTAIGWSPSFGVGRAVRIVLCLLSLAIFALPFVSVVASAFNSPTLALNLTFWPTEPSLESFQRAIDVGVLHYFGNSLVIAGGGLALQIVLSIMCAYALSRKKFRGQGIVFMLFLLTMMLPEEVIAVPLASVLGDLPVLGVSVRGTPLGVILPVAIWGFTILIMTEFMKEIPVEIEEAARLDGVGELGMLWRIILPLSKPVLGVATIFGFMMIWDQYLLPLIAADSTSDYTLTVALAGLREDAQVGPGVLLVGALLALTPSVILYLALQRSLVRGLTSGATKG